MGTDFDTFCQSDLGVFIESMLGVRGCAVAVAENVGACCLPTNECVMKTAEQCETLSGEFVGVGVDCVDVDCGAFDCPKSITSGGCCTPETVESLYKGRCLSSLTSAECTQVRSLYAGDDEGCDRSCFTPEPSVDHIHPDTDTGRCCWTEERGRWVPEENRCDYSNADVELRCASGGSALGHLFTESGCHDWIPMTCNESPGHCCRNGTFVGWAWKHSCLGSAGTAASVEEECGSEQGWCCDGCTGNFAWTLRGNCPEFGGPLGAFVGPVQNPESHCPRIAPCCLPDSEGIVHCERLSTIECERLGGRVLGNCEDTCSDVTCGVGGCCLGCGRCVDNIDAAECALLGGQYQGDDTECLGGVAGCPGRGACCAGDEGECQDPRTLQQCSNISGIFFGKHKWGVTPTLCTDPGVDCLAATSGACCIDGICSITPNAGACPGTFAGAGTNCEDVDCSVGACCFRIGQGVFCSAATPDLCDANGGTFVGFGVPCSQGLCDGII